MACPSPDEGRSLSENRLGSASTTTVPSEAPVAGAPVGSAELTSATIEEGAGQLRGRTVAVLATDGVEEIELTAPRQAFRNEGARTALISTHGGEIQAFNRDDKGDAFSVDETVDGADPRKFDALVLPGGVRSSDALRLDPKAVAFVRAFAVAGKPIAAISHGPWLLVDANVVRGKTMTSWPSLKTDVANAGARWVDVEVADDHGLVTSRKPEDLAAFDAKAIEELANRTGSSP
jgi:protease I